MAKFRSGVCQAELARQYFCAPTTIANTIRRAWAKAAIQQEIAPAPELREPILCDATPKEIPDDVRACVAVRLAELVEEAKRLTEELEAVNSRARSLEKWLGEWV